jgi:hypothetical protein
VTSAACSPDGKRIVTASSDKTARLWDAATGQPIGMPLAGHTDYVNGAAFSPDGKRIVTASADKTARLFWALPGFDRFDWIDRLGKQVALSTQEATMASFVAWHNKTLSEHNALRNQYYPQGFRFISLSIYGSTSAPVYAAVMLQAASPVTQHDFPNMTAQQWQQTFNAQASQGFGPIILSATVPHRAPPLPRSSRHRVPSRLLDTG